MIPTIDTPFTGNSDEAYKSSTFLKTTCMTTHLDIDLHSLHYITTMDHDAWLHSGILF